MKKFLFLFVCVAILVSALSGCGKSNLQGEWGCYVPGGPAYSLEIKGSTLKFGQFGEMSSLVSEYHYKRDKNILYLSLIKMSGDGGVTWEKRGGEDGLIKFSLNEDGTLDFNGKRYVKSSELLKEKKFFDGTWTAHANGRPGATTTVNFDGNDFVQDASHEASLKGKVIRKGSQVTYDIKKYCEDGKNWKKADSSAKIQGRVLILDESHFADLIEMGEYGVVAQIFTKVLKESSSKSENKGEMPDNSSEEITIENPDTFSGTYTSYDADKNIGKIIVFTENSEFILMEVADDKVVSHRLTYKKAGNKYYVKLLATYRDFAWEEEKSTEELIAIDKADYFLVINEEPLTNWEMACNDAAETNGVTIETYFDGTWSNSKTSAFQKNNVMIFKDKHYKTDSGFEGNFSYKDNTLFQDGYNTPIYILDENHFASIPDTDGETICNIYERIENEN
ncbi:hypothetical protein [Treponema sp.]|uniref:hypothetical protein n=1 Tax=Treponema sp. TaxID=166 RepID=UPI00388F51C7